MPLLCRVIASGSKGNAVLVCSPTTSILVDAGLSAKELVRRLDQAPASARQLNAVVLSHEHQDHVRGAGVLSRRFDLPVFLTRGTLDYLPSQTGLLPNLQIIQPGASFQIGDLRIHPFATSHDAHESVGFTIEHGGFKLGICTDLGVATQLVRARLQLCHGLILEANHDIEMLLNGPYPWELKQRIRSRHGHLSNVDTLELLRAVHHEHLQTVVFAHLSETNNHPDRVRTIQEELQNSPEWEGVRFEIGKQHEVSAEMELA